MQLFHLYCFVYGSFFYCDIMYNTHLFQSYKKDKKNKNNIKTYIVGCKMYIRHSTKKLYVYLVTNKIEGH